MRILGQGEEIKMGIGKHQAFFEPRLKEGRLTQVLLISQLIEAEFPDYQGVIPKEYKVAIMVDKDELFRAIKRVSLLSNEKSRLLKFRLKENVLSISANTPEIGSSYEDLTVKREGEEDIGIGFNSTYLLDGLKNMEGEIRVELTDSVSPGVIKPAVKEDGNYIYIIMPIRIEEE
jgi:DNA polymerase-3 subunit beta